MPIYTQSANGRQMTGTPPGEYIAHQITCDVTSDWLRGVYSDTTQLTQLNNSVQPNQSCFCLWRHNLQTESTGSLRSLIGDSCSRWERVDNSTSSWVELRQRSVYSDTDATQLNVELSTRSQREQQSVNKCSDPVDSVCRSWRHKQKHDWLGCTLFNWVSWVQLSWVELCRYKHPFTLLPGRWRHYL